MHKEIFISILVIIIVIIMNIVSQNYTDTKMEEIVNYLTEIRNDLLVQKSSEEVKNNYDKMYKDWKENFNVFAYYIEHDELEKVELELVTLKAYIDTNYKEDAVSNAERAQYIIDHIKEKYRFNLKNIF